MIEIEAETAQPALAEDLEGLVAFDKRAKGPSLSFEDVLEDLKLRGKI